MDKQRIADKLARDLTAGRQNDKKLAQNIMKYLEKVSKDNDWPDMFEDTGVWVGKKEVNRMLGSNGDVALHYDGLGNEFLTYSNRSQYRNHIIKMAKQMGYFAEDYSNWALSFYYEG